MGAVKFKKKLDPGGNIGRFCTVYMKKNGNFGRKKPGKPGNNREFQNGKSLVTLDLVWHNLDNTTFDLPESGI